MQTVPPWVYLIPAVMIFSLGKVPALMATVIYGVPPMLRLTTLAFRQVPKELIELGAASGATALQTLTRIEIPSARKTLLIGLNQCILLSLAMVVLEGMVVGVDGVRYVVPVDAIRMIVQPEPDRRIRARPPKGARCCASPRTRSSRSATCPAPVPKMRAGATSMSCWAHRPFRRGSGGRTGGAAACPAAPAEGRSDRSAESDGNRPACRRGCRDGRIGQHAVRHPAKSRRKSIPAYVTQPYGDGRAGGIRIGCSRHR